MLTDKTIQCKVLADIQTVGTIKHLDWVGWRDGKQEATSGLFVPDHITVWQGISCTNKLYEPCIIMQVMQKLC